MDSHVLAYWPRIFKQLKSSEHNKMLENKALGG